MATIINTLEVIVEPPRPASAGAPSPTPPQPPAPHDLVDVWERRARYAARVFAH
jgi:hypothetical protein